MISDISATLLWTNPNMDSDFVAQDIPIPQLANFKYAILTFKGYKTYDNADAWIMKVQKQPTSPETCISWVSAEYNTLWSRKFKVSSSTNIISFYSAYQSNFSTNQVADERLIPIHIYGTNFI